MLHLLVPMKKPVTAKEFVDFNKELQKVCNKYGMGEIYVYLKEDNNEGN